MTKKKLVSIVTTAVAIIIGIAMVLVSHNNIKTAEKNNSLLADNFTELLKITEEILDAKKTGGAPRMLNYVRENKTRAVNAVNNVRSVCDYFEKVKVPKSLKNELAEVREGIPAMRTFLDKYENMFHEVMLESEFMSYVGEMSGSAESSAGFVAAEQKFMRKLKSLRQNSSRYNHFWWL